MAMLLACISQGCDVDNFPIEPWVSVQIEVPDLAGDLERALVIHRLEPVIRVGVDLYALSQYGHDAFAFYDEVKAGTTLEAWPGDVPVELTRVDHSDETNSIRQGFGFLLVPDAPLPDGWYRVSVDLPPIPSDMQWYDPVHFANVRSGNRIVSRFHQGELRYVSNLVVVCGDAPAWAEHGLADLVGRHCHFSFLTSGSEGRNAGNVAAVTIDGAATECVRRSGLYGPVCPQPPEASLVEVTPTPDAGTGPSGEPAAPFRLVFDSTVPTEPSLAVLLGSDFTAWSFPVADAAALPPVD